MAEALLAFRSPFAGLVWGHPALSVEDLSGVSLASVIARKGQAAALKRAVRRRYGVDLPDGPRWVTGDGIAFVGMGPGSWLAVGGVEAFDGLASITDQSGAYGLLRLSGPNLREILAKGPFIDFAAFTPGQAAVTTLAHIGVVLWQVDATTFDMAAPRSVALDLWRWLEESAS